MACLNTHAGQRGVVRILVRSADEKRSVRNFVDAFLLDEPRLKPMVKRMMPEKVILHGGISLVIDSNDVRLATGQGRHRHDRLGPAG